jgi:multisubunit Na+/H+ antiporter MnhB subunit
VGRLFLGVLGVAFAAGAVLGIVVVVNLIATFSDPDLDVPFGFHTPGASMAAIKVTGIAIFALFTLLAAAAANLLLDHPLRRVRRWWARRSAER